MFSIFFVETGDPLREIGHTVHTHTHDVRENTFSSDTHVGFGTCCMKFVASKNHSGIIQSLENISNTGCFSVFNFKIKS